MLYGMIANIILKCKKKEAGFGSIVYSCYSGRIFREHFRSGIIIVGEDRDFELDLRNEYDVESFSKIFVGQI